MIPCRTPLLALLALLLGLVAPPAAAGATAGSEAPEAAALSDLGELLGRIEAGLAALGAAPEPGPDGAFVAGESVPPLRELCLHARELWRKADRLARARHAVAGRPLPPLLAEPEVEDLRELLEAAVLRLAAAGAPAAAAPLEVEADTPRQVLAALRSADRALEELLVEPPTRGDVHLLVTRALAFASAVRVRFPGRRMPLTPPEEELATNDDVHQALVQCWVQVESLMAISGLQRLSHEPQPEPLGVGLARIQALAALLCDELELLHALHGDLERLPPACHPGERRTSELHQRVQLLGRQLRELQDLAATRQALARGEADS